MTAYRIPPDVIRALGGVVPAHAVLSDTLGVSYFASDPGTIAPHIVSDLGNGSAAAGRQVLNKFMSRIRASKNGVIIRGRRANVKADEIIDGELAEDMNMGGDIDPRPSPDFRPISDDKTVP